MNWKDLASAGKSIGKLDSLDVGADTKVTMEAIMCAMAASGKVQEMALIAQTLEKVDTKVDLKEVNANLNELVGIMKAKEQPEPGMTAANAVLAKLQAENDALRAELAPFK